MAKLYFKYGAMGSSKSAQALITKFNYEERGMSVWLMKPGVDERDGADLLRSRIGLSARAMVVTETMDIHALYLEKGRGIHAIIVDEAQFLSPAHVDQLRAIVDEHEVPVLCFGLRTDFMTHLFPGSRRLLEVADSLVEIKTICACGRKATVNARIDAEGHVITQGDQILLGGNDAYMAMCHACWAKAIQTGEAVR